MWSREIFVTIVVALAVSVTNVMPYYNDFQRTRAHSPNEADFLKTNINWERKFGDPDFKDAIHFRLNQPDQKPTESINENKTNEITVVNLGKPAVRVKTADLTKLPTKSSNVANINQNFNGNPYMSHPHDYEHNTGKGEIFIHRPSPIIIKRPPTKVLINHPPLVVKPAPVVFHRPPPVVVRPVVMKSKSRNVKVQPVYVNVEGGKSKKNSLEDKENFDKTLYGNRYYPARNGIYKNSH